MTIVTRVKQYVHATAESYEAEALMGLLFGLTGVFVLSAAFVWLTQKWGGVIACLIFAAGFLLAALAFKAISSAKQTEAKKEIRAVMTEEPLKTAAAVSHAFQSATPQTMSPMVRPAIAIVILLTALYYLTGDKEAAANEIDIC